MKRRLLNMDPDKFSKLKCEGAGFLVERNIAPQGIQLVNPFAVAKHESMDLVSLAQEIQRADALVRATANSKLQIIAEQMRFLQQQAHKVLLEARQSAELHRAACNFRKLPDHIYYLYERPSGQQYFSMLSPEDWLSSSGGPPHSFIGSYRLEQDLSWTPEAAIRPNTMAVVDKLMSSNGFKFSDSETLDVDML